MKFNHRNILLVFLFTLITACQSLPKGVGSVEVTWLYGEFALPDTVTISGKTEFFKPSYTDEPWVVSAKKLLKQNVKLPIAIHMHGCGGIGENDDAYAYRDILLSQGYGVFMPDSFQRPGRDRLCGQGGMHERIALRQSEIRYALKEIRKLTWVKQDQLVLMGFSEGGNAADNWYTNDFAGLIILGSACTHSGGSPTAPDEVPVLAIVGEADDYRPGMSCTISRSIGGSKSVVISGGDHWIASYSQTKDSILKFLKQCCK